MNPLLKMFIHLLLELNECRQHLIYSGDGFGVGLEALFRGNHFHEFRNDPPSRASTSVSSISSCCSCSDAAIVVAASATWQVWRPEPQ